ncbi:MULTISPECIES: cytochrome c [Stappiaceae]|jgi:cytochrome c556|uniref:c-type cytochrome n=1 Tax=Stappiaceae TaxID=2821832 RepID=UPI0009F9DD02|nr:MULTISPECIES: cytochrome c [Stappiaceae]MBO9463226.1 cytochrome c [Labrenzia sp. R5_0]UES53885.1 cytochrome c [Roseibium aggregatum]UFI06771.1 cytochrome c [Roseibium aggregatum]
MKFKVMTIAGTLVLAGAAAALAHGGATGVVKERMDAMGEMGDVMKSLSSIMRGDKGYDAAAVRSGAEAIQSHSGEALTKLFPEHSIEGSSEAKPEIWSNWQEFKSLADQLDLFAAALGQGADNGLAHGGDGAGMMGGSSMMSQDGMMGTAPMMGDASQMANPEMLAQMPADGLFNMVAQTCSACHSKFRVEKK